MSYWSDWSLETDRPALRADDLGRCAWSKPWEPYRPRRLPWRELPQIASIGLFAGAAYLAITLEAPAWAAAIIPI